MATDLKGFKINKLSFGKPSGKPLIASRYIKPPRNKEIKERYLKHKFAIDLAKDITPEREMYVFAFLDGTFFAGDFVEAWIIEHSIKVKILTISTLSLNENNIDSLAGLLNIGIVERLNLIVSDYFFSHERQNLIPYAYKELDREDRFQLAVAGTHCKLILMETEGGAKVVIHGSANLRSSSNIETLCIEENPELYDFVMEVQQSILDKYKTINKSVRYNALWQADQK